MSSSTLTPLLGDNHHHYVYGSQDPQGPPPSYFSINSTNNEEIAPVVSSSQKVNPVQAFAKQPYFPLTQFTHYWGQVKIIPNEGGVDLYLPEGQGLKVYDDGFKSAGNGEYFLSQTPEKFYQGPFMSGKRHGKDGVFETPEKICSGTWNDDLFVEGVTTYKEDNSSFSGTYHSNGKKRTGVYVTVDKIKYDGTWDDTGMFTGLMTDLDGKKMHLVDDQETGCCVIL